MAQTITTQDLNKNKQPGQQNAQPGQANTIQGLPQKPKGSGFTNIQRVLGANQTNQLGGAVGGGIQKQTQQAGQQFQNANQQFQQQSQANRLDTQQNAQTRQDVANRYAVGNQSQDVQGPSDQEVNQFSQFRAGNYGGPTELNQSQELANQAQDLSNTRQAFNSDSGRLGLLQRFVGGGKQYTSGQQRLDNLLLGAGGNQAQINQGLQGSLRGANEIQRGIQASKLAGEDLTNRAKLFGEQTGNMLNANKTALSSDLDTRVKTGQESRDQRLDELKKAFTSGTGDVELTDQEMQDLGVGEGQDVFGNYSDYLTKGVDANRQNVASAQDYTKFGGLAKLLGQGQDVEFADPNQAGGFEKNKYDFGTDLKTLADKNKREALGAASGDIAQMLTALRASKDVSLSSRFNPFYGTAMGGHSGSANPEEIAEQERQVANEARGKALAALSARGVNVTGDLASAFGDMGDQDNWYKNTYGGGDFGQGVMNNSKIMNLLKGSRSFKKKV